VPLSAIASATLERTGVPPFAQILGRFVGNSQQLDVILSALEEKGLARRLAEPNLVALSGDTASFLAGGEFPIPSGSSGGAAGIPTIQIVFKEFGVRLSFTPTVMANGAINLRLEPEVSEIDPAISVNTGLVNVPGLSKRRAKTTVELRDGQSFAIAGLLQSISQTDLEQFPWLGSVPVIGALLRSTSFRHRETELVVIVTPHLVKPARPGAIMATPLDTTAPANDVDLFLMGQIERKKSGASRVEQYIPAAGSVSGPHGHILTAPAPVVAPRLNPPMDDPPNTVRVRN
jgi:pilus assembly protein CpaC